MTTSALTGGFAVCQTRLGAKIHDPKDPGSDLGPMFRQVVGTILRLADKYPEHWLPIHGSHDVPAYGFERIIDPPPLEVNTLRLLSEFHAGSLTLADTWRAMLAPATAETVLELAAEAGRLGDQARNRLGLGGDVASTTATTLEMADAVASFHFPDDVWARVVYDLVVAARDPKACVETLVAALVPDLLRARRQLRRSRTAPSRPPRPRTASSARLASSSCSSRTWSIAGAETPAGRWQSRRRRHEPRRRCPPGSSSRSPIPTTAEELIRLGAAMMDPRAGELSALGIVEVPEGMPLSEGATRARHARRLLQRVLDYAPDGTTIHPLVRIGRHAAEGIIEASAEQEADLIIFGWGGKTPPVVTWPVRPCSRRRSTRSSASPRATSPSSSSAAPGRSSGSWSRSAAARTRSWPCATPTRSPATTTPPSWSSTSSRPGITMAVRAQAERALTAFIKQHLKGRGEALLKRPPTSATRSCARPRSADLVVMGASASRGRRGRRDATCSGRCPRRSRRGPSRASWSSRRASPSNAPRSTSWPRGPRRWPPPIEPPRRRARCRREVERWFGESNFHHAEFADLRRLVDLKEKQRLTVSLVLPTLNEEETIGPIVRRAMREMVGRVPLLDEVLVIDSLSTDRTREIAEAEGARVVASPRRPPALRLLPSARARRSGSRCSRPPATSSCGPTPT